MAGLIPAGQFPPGFTGAIEARFDELQDIKVNDFGRSFFPVKLCPERYPVIEVRRGTEKVAIDTVRGSKGVRTQITKFDAKVYDPFYYRYWFDATELTNYFKVFGSRSYNVNDGASLANGMAVALDENKKMIERARELMAFSIFENGTITSLRDNSIVDFKRQPGSMVNLLPGSLWTDAGVDPNVSLKAGGDYLRQTGKASGYVINAICGTEAWDALINNSQFRERLKEFNNNRDMLPQAQKNTTGEVFQGEITVSSYKFRFFTYNEFYDDPLSTVAVPLPMKPYKNPKTVVLLPENPMFTCLCGAIPNIGMPGENTSSLLTDEYVVSDFINREEKYHRFVTESAPINVPVTVDRIYTLQPIA
jgi:hypothetical protein